MVKAGVIRGMKAISDFTGYSEPTLIRQKQSYPGMPMNKIAGEWLANQEALEQFYRDLAAGRSEIWLAPPGVSTKTNEAQAKFTSFPNNAVSIKG